MKGFELTVNGKKIKGAIEKGSTGVLLTYKDNQYHVDFGSMDETGMRSYTWHSSNLEDGAKLTISVEEIAETSETAVVRDVNNEEQLNKSSLENYYKLRDELIKEGVIKG